MSNRDYVKRRQSRRAKPGALSASAIGEEREPVCFFAADGVLVLRNAELFQPGHEVLCGRLLEEFVKQSGVRSARASMSTGTCEIEFPAGQADRGEIANRIASAFHLVLAPEALNGDASGSEESWSALSAFRGGRGLSLWQTVGERPGRLRLRNRLLQTDGTLARRVAGAVGQLPGVESCRATLWGRDLEIRFDATTMDSKTLTRAVADALEHGLGAVSNQLTIAKPGSPVVARGLARGWYMALAAGSFALTIVGIVLPIVPTVPFLMATSYYLVRASPALNRRLLRSRFFGPILEDLQTWGGLRPINKLKLIGLALAFGVVTVVLIGPPVFVVVIMVGVYSATIYFIARMPGVPAEFERAERQRQLGAALAPG